MKGARRIMAFEYCPRCRVLAVVETTETRERRVDSMGVYFDVTVRAVHCSGCHTFIRREEIPLPHPSQHSPSV